MSVEQTSYFTNGLDLDSDIRAIEQGFYTLLHNASGVTNERNKQAAENIKSNIQITRFWIPQYAALPGDNGFRTLTSINPTGTISRVIGRAEDIRNNAIIYFVWNSGGSHAIFRYWVSPKDPNGVSIPSFIEPLTNFVPTINGTNVVSAITWGSLLDFNRSNPFFNVKVIETGKVVNGSELAPSFDFRHPVFGNNYPLQIIPFTDGRIEPKRLTTLDLYYQISGKYAVTSGNFFDVGKDPGYPIVTIWSVDANRKTNRLKYKHYQFRYRYKYKDGEYSSLSPISDIFHQGDVLALAERLQAAQGAKIS